MRIVGARRYTTISPLRYPGGKASLAGPLADLINTLDSHITCYVEPYAGGAGAGITLLHEGIVDRLVINDIDPAVYSFWKTVTTENDRLVEQIGKVPLTIEEWKRQRAIYRNPNTGVGFELGFAFFYLNRTNRSGILTGGVIGGLQQQGTYRLGARFNRETLANRIRALSEIGDRIEVTAKDGRTVIREYAKRENTFMYVNPPYVKAGSRLYLKSFDRHDHINLADTIKETAPPYWLMTYDDTPLIRELYQGFPQGVLELAYSTNRKTRVEELVVASPKVAAAIHYVS
ncbi:DNA adenine methylase [Mobiluncus curtisii]|uniref:DNA adenine methylase n=1 Tax=Mobiluncus curtisii TaxID=2051 RepID=UPI001B8B06BE|nr:DNA adenine methylase [Mobiluncus curtisii]